jgi:NADH-quinone oxidoreductase subunit L
VALSTLSQLGLIFIALSTGRAIICLFHLVIHAIAKANLFLIVGNLLHLRFSQQDSRKISSGTEEIGIFLLITISAISLRGVLFLRGFYSKDYVILREINLFNRSLTFLVLTRVITITAAYCIKLISFTIKLEKSILISHESKRSFFIMPSLFLRAFRLRLGLIIIINVHGEMLLIKTGSGHY